MNSKDGVTVLWCDLRHESEDKEVRGDWVPLSYPSAGLKERGRFSIDEDRDEGVWINPGKGPEDVEKEEKAKVPPTVEEETSLHLPRLFPLLISRNPNQSKHLETARMRLFDVWIDFINLSTEDYIENSRIPTMACKYELILTITVGIMILDNYSTRFGFLLDEELKKAAADNDVRVAITNKICRERIGQEIDLMISGDQLVKAMTYIADLKSFWVVFSLPSDFEPSIPDGCDREKLSSKSKGMIFFALET
ncbi:putative CCA tRNA nucleotidyltransferase 2 [Capsicum baccatum]|uniref:CCA tRNA nucleotidyltransferase 2 n=1 Tax=Capsicum baccatum TaxID=33114 RepID=A0A2G2WY99_CAPBA|nr:putative CCA tRNA nucleotidyltransferase 2 [Capsicum baccatum]